MNSSLAFSLSPLRTLLVVALASLGLVYALPASAATAQISATPTTIASGQSATVTWLCSNGTVTASIGGVGEVSLSGSMSVSPTITKTYTLTCTDSLSATAASVTVTVDAVGCYEESTVSVQGNYVYPNYNESSTYTIFEEEGANALNGGGTYDAQNHYQRCINECASASPTGTCNYKFVNDHTSGEQSLTKYHCMAVVPVAGELQSKPMQTQYNLAGQITKETIWWGIKWTASSGGTCVAPPPPPTVDLVATPTSISSGGTSKLTWTSTNADSCTNTFSSNTAVNNATTGVNVSPTVTTNYYITCSNEAGQVSDSARVTVGSAPDLTAGSILPTTTTAAVATTLNATTTNNGAATTGASFPVLFQRATTSGGANATNLGSTTTSVLAAGASRNVQYTTNTAAFPTAGTWYVRACSDQRTGGDLNGLITESNENNNCGAWTKITVAAGASYPNLTAGLPAPNSAVVSTATVFNSTITNSNATSTGRTFTNLFQFDNNVDHTTVYATKTDGSPILASDGTDTTSVSYTFPTTGTWYVRTCADTNTNMAGVVSESNEGDNCSAWRTVTVEPTPGASSLSCTATPATVTVGGTVAYSAIPTGLNPYSWVPSETGTPLGGTSANVSRTYNTAGNYGMTVTSNDGRVASCPAVVVGNPCSNPQLSISAEPDRVRTGTTATLTVSATGVSGSCTLSGPGINQTLVADQCVVDEITVTTPPISTQSVYTLTCGGSTAQTVVNVIPAYEVF